MSTFQIIDLICDLFNPLLLLCGLIIIVKMGASKQWRKMLTATACMLYSLAVVYLLYFLDRAFNLWPQFVLDYSTHTAFALVMCVFLIAHTGRVKFFSFALLFYLFAMLYQKYHTLADILTTALAITLLLLPIYFWRFKQREQLNTFLTQMSGKK